MKTSVWRQWPLVFLMAWVSVFSGCGGGSSKKSGPPTNSTLTNTQVSQTLGDIGRKWDGLPKDTAQQATAIQEMLRFLQQRPEVSASAVGGGGASIWIYLKNGMAVVLSNSLQESPLSVAGNANQVVRSLSKGTEIPSSSKVYLANALGNYFTSVTPHISQYLTAPESGYSISSSNSTIEGLKISGNGAFLLQTHGESSPIILSNYPTRYSMATSVEPPLNGQGNPIIEPKYQADYDAGRIGLSYANQTKIEKGKPRVEWRYAITDEFVRKYMKFDNNSFVMMHACEGGNDVAKHAFFDANVSVYAGWTKVVDNNVAIRASEYTFQKMLGYKVNGKAVDYAEIKENLKKLGWDINPANKAELVFYANPKSPNFAQLAPSIDSATYDKITQQITINGTFGTDPGSAGVVTLGTTVLSRVGDWTATKLIYSAAGIASGTYNLSVTVRDHKSNNVSVVIPSSPTPAPSPTPRPIGTPVPTATPLPTAPTAFSGSISFYERSFRTEGTATYETSEELTGSQVVFSGSEGNYQISKGSLKYHHIFTLNSIVDGKPYKYTEEEVERYPNFSSLQYDGSSVRLSGGYIFLIRTITVVRDGETSSSVSDAVSSRLFLLPSFPVSQSGGSTIVKYDKKEDKDKKNGTGLSVNLVGSAGKKSTR